MSDDANAVRVAPILGFRDVRKAADYYRDTFGFSYDPRTGILDGVGDERAVYAIVRRGGVEIHLQIRRREHMSRERESIESDAYVFVSDVESLYADLQRRGAKIYRPLQDEPYGLRDFTVEDLEGHRLAFGAPL